VVGGTAQPARESRDGPEAVCSRLLERLQLFYRALPLRSPSPLQTTHATAMFGGGGWGQNNQNNQNQQNPPATGGIFGQPAAAQPSAFGTGERTVRFSSSSRNSPPIAGFGTTNAFGANNNAAQPATSIFGQPAANTAGTTSAFGMRNFQGQFGPKLMKTQVDSASLLDRPLATQEVYSGPQVKHFVI
jgi:hypothetical protein